MRYMVSLLALVFCSVCMSQDETERTNVLPNNHASGEELIQYKPIQKSFSGQEIVTPPEFPVRTMAEWEEIQALVITWAGFPDILKQIAFHAKQECEVIIIADNISSVTNYLNSNNSGGAPFDNLENITVITDNFNSIWGRDYGAHTIYRDDVDELLLVDWIYNRNRPADDLVPLTIAQYYGLPLYSTTEEPYDLMATGGNWMSDGLGTAFSSELIEEENSGGFAWGGTQYPSHSTEEVESILNDFMGIDDYILMDMLPYDVIHHIDMHMKLLDEETLIIGQYPTGVADGPQIEANIEYVMDNYNSAFGTPYEVVRVQMPPEGGSYPNGNGDYRTYTNMVFVNKTVLVPIYEEQYDSPALDIIESELPGYNVVGIECNDIIPLSGAIHCITKAVGVADPLLIVHDHLDDTEDDVNDYVVDAMAKHVSGVSEASIFYRVDGGSFTEVDMSLTSSSEDIWTGYIPAQSAGSIIDYYVNAVANSGKQQVRPIVAPEGYWTFEVTGSSVGLEEFNGLSLISEVYPNPASAITVIRLDLPSKAPVNLTLQDMLGRTVSEIYNGTLVQGKHKFFMDAANYTAGSYTITVTSGNQRFSQKLMIR